MAKNKKIDKNKAILYSSIAVVVIILLIVISISFNKTTEPEEKIQIEDIPAEDIGISKSNLNYSICEEGFREVRALNIQEYCYQSVSAEKSSENCNELENKNMQPYCLNGQAVARDTLNHCETESQTNNTGDFCFLGFALKRSDINICGNISETGLKSSCFLNFAISSGNVQICDLIDVREKKFKCISRIVRNNYEMNKTANYNHNVCQKIVGTFMKEKNDCYSIMAQQERDEKLCEFVSEILRDSCYAGASITTKNSTICENIKANSARDLCEYSVAAHTSNIKICESYYSNAVKGDCYKKFAATTGNSTHCNFFEEGIDRNICLFGIVQELARPDSENSIAVSLCSELKGLTSPNENSCYKWLAFETRQAEICDNIESQTLKETCTDDVLSIHSGSLILCQNVKDASKRKRCFGGVLYKELEGTQFNI